MGMIFKTIKGEVKKEEDGSLNIFIPLSTMSMDRDGEVVEPSAFKKTISKFMLHPVLVASHDYKDLKNQIGEWTKLKVTDTGLEGKPKYYKGAGNDTADWAYYLASKGVAAFSIGFIPKDWIDGDGIKTPRKTYKDVELLEISHCIIPSQREAVMAMRSKSVDPVIQKMCDETLKELPEIVTKPEVTDNTIRIPVDSGDHTGHTMRTIQISQKDGIQALYCVPDKKVLTYIFSKEKWDMDKAKEWVKEHKSFNAEKEVSQNEILDEIDYLDLLIKENGMNESVEKSFNELTKKYFTNPYLTEEYKKELKDVTQPTKEAVNEKEIKPEPPKEEVKVSEPTNQEILDELNKVEV